MYALVDCNNFYASCERLFRPDLNGRPIVVLSNNDGCVVARSTEAKSIGMKMGMPYFKIKDMIQHHHVIVFSSNYALYGELSNRVMTTLEALAPAVEVYSIDEAFLDVTGISALMPLTEFGQQVRQTIDRWVGLPVCVGIAPTKTLAKLANHAAKQYPATRGVVDLSEPDRQRRLLSLLPVHEVWGIGRRLTDRLQALGITTALALADADPQWLRSRFSVVLERTIRELNGVPCIELEHEAPTKQQIVCSRSFGAPIKEKSVMQEAVASYLSRAMEELRREQRLARSLQVFIRTSPFREQDPQYNSAATGQLHEPSQDTRPLMGMAMRLLDSIWKDGYPYSKAGVMLSDFYEPNAWQPDLLSDQSSSAKGSVSFADNPQLMQVLDTINAGSLGKIWFARQGARRDWQMKRERLSPSYLSRWAELPKVR